ncbi:NitT/TauT family transport system substrate-binding protein [Orenia metallireducens]|uniref:NitT/TauT family transport system substrate-binding protein n=1 Tax=Orenia metallireducens TaxID=1413210 RepID=A0A285GHB8_9FIRM|nr:ABC transporter substrate-binding protein [Orenia metallireducens]PRX30467.1 NitT/TauT family transport system substrate-binding protein [Orenia metallireducens]SNY22713.1 NitT/TauT family transport system substrate-binding protein [Orenia metallireducens]
MRKIKGKGIILLLSSILTLSLLMAGCSSTNEEVLESGENIITIQAYGELDPQVSAQQIIAEKMGYFEEEGLNVENHLMTGPDKNAPLVANGVAEVAFGSVYNNIAVAANNVEVKVLAPLANAGGTQAVVIRGDIELESAKDLESKKIAMTSGAGVLIAIRNMCEELGVDIDKIEFINMQPSDQLAAFTRGDVDAIAIWEPWVGKAVDAGGRVLFSGTEANLPEKQGAVHWIDFYMTVQVTDEFYEEHPEATVKLLKALSKATDFINQNPDQAAEIIAEEINISKEDTKRIMGKNSYSMEFDEQFIEGSNTMAEFMKGMNNIKAVPDFYDYGFPTPLEKVDSSLVTVSQ